MEVLLYIEDPCMVLICNARMARLRHDVVGGIYIYKDCMEKGQGEMLKRKVYMKNIEREARCAWPDAMRMSQNRTEICQSKKKEVEVREHLHAFNRQCPHGESAT